MADSIAFTTFVLYMLGMAALAIRGFFVHNALAAHAIAAGFKGWMRAGMRFGGE